MRDHLYKFLPLVFGGLLGWLLTRPPAWLQALGPLAYAVNVGLLLLALISFVALMLIKNLPERLSLEPVADGDVAPALRRLGEEITRLGFRPAGPALRAGMSPSAVLLGFVHPTEPVYATAFRTESAPPKIANDFVTILHGERGSLTTGADPGGAAIPAGPGEFRQVLPGEAVEGLYRSHLEAMDHLRRQGLDFRPVSGGTLRQDLVAAVGRQRERVLQSPLSAAWVTLWRTATRRGPHLGPLAEQELAARQLARMPFRGGGA